MKADELDDAIDAAVRDIMRREPPAGLRARVMGRLSADYRPPFLSMPRLAVAAAFVVCLVTGFVLTRSPRPAAGTAASAVDVADDPPSAPLSATPAAPPRIQAPEERIALAAPAARRGPQSAAEERRVSAMSIDETSAALPIAPLTPMPAIEATPLFASPVSINQLAIRSLEMAPVQVEPLPSTPR